MQCDKKIKNCRLCNNDKFYRHYEFGNLPLGNNLLSNYRASLLAKTYPLNLIQCKNCFHFQLDYSVSPKELYATNYTYLSGIGSSFISHIKEYVNFVVKKCNLKKDMFVLDIGSNDGTCLKEFQKYKLIVCGVDPAKKPAEIANKNGITTINSFFNNNSIKKILNTFGKPDLVSSQNALAHIDDLYGTFTNIFKILKNDGFFVFEVGYFKTVLKKQLFDTIYHEHLDYHHANPIAKILNNIGFSLINITQNNSQGGSIRFILQKKNIVQNSKQVQSFLKRELNTELYDKNYIKKWLNDIKKNLRNLNDFLNKNKKNKRPIICYGAPTKATLLLELSKINLSNIKFILEDNNLKIGKFLPKHGIEIKATQELKNFDNCIIIILAWNFSSDIIEKLKIYNKDIIVLIPLPKFKVVRL